MRDVRTISARIVIFSRLLKMILKKEKMPEKLVTELHLPGPHHTNVQLLFATVAFLPEDPSPSAMAWLTMQAEDFTRAMGIAAKPKKIAASENGKMVLTSLARKVRRDSTNGTIPFCRPSARFKLCASCCTRKSCTVQYLYNISILVVFLHKNVFL